MENNISILLAFGSGLLSFLSPCVIPLIPSYLGLMLGNYAETGNKKKLLASSLIFIAGFSIIFILLGMTASFLGQVLLRNLSILKKISGIIVIILGVHLTGLIKLKFLYQEKKMELSSVNNNYLRSLLMGLSMAVAWTPCIGPILSSILIYAGTAQTITQGGLLLTFYSLGFAVPFFLTALFLNYFLEGFNRIKKHLPLIQKISGVLIIILGILIITDSLEIFTNL